MAPLRPIFWGQGLFLQPQHFQQQDLYHDERLRHYLHLLVPFCWGVRTLSIRESALQNFLFDIEHCEIVTAEGTMLSFRGDTSPSNARITPCSFEHVLDPEGEGKALEVFLGIKRLQWEDKNIADEDELAENGRDAASVRRYSLHKSIVPNLFGDQEERSDVTFLMHEPHILFDPDTVTNGGYEAVKIAEVVRSGEGQGALLSNRYIPPLLSVHGSPVLLGLLKDVRDQLITKSHELQDFKRQRGSRALEMGSRETFFLMVMQLLNRYIPLLRHILEIEETHPCEVYVSLRQLVGELSTFSETLSLADEPLPSYRHEHLRECFEPVVRLILNLLRELASGPEFVVPLLYDGEYFTSDLEPRFFDGGNHYYLSIKSNLAPRELERRLMETGKVCSREEMTILRQQFIPGLPVRYLETPPEELPRRALCSYFEVDHRVSLWRRIEERQNIAVFCELAPEETDMQLFVISES